MFTQIYINRPKLGINNLIKKSQSGLLKERSIYNNLRFVLHLVEYSHFIEYDGYILFLDSIDFLFGITNILYIKTNPYFMRSGLIEIFGQCWI